MKFVRYVGATTPIDADLAETADEYDDDVTPRPGSQRDSDVARDLAIDEGRM